MARGFFGGQITIVKKPRRKRPGIHSKSKNTNQKTGKYYAGTKYRGQGR